MLQHEKLAEVSRRGALDIYTIRTRWRSIDEGDEIMGRVSRNIHGEVPSVISSRSWSYGFDRKGVVSQ